MAVSDCYIFLIQPNQLAAFVYLRRITLNNFLQARLLFCVRSSIYRHFLKSLRLLAQFLQLWITRCAVFKILIIHYDITKLIFAASCFRMRYLGNEIRLTCNSAPDESVRSSFSNIVVNVYFRILIALTNDSAIALLNIRRPPLHVKMMHSNKLVLDINACAGSRSTAKQHSDFTILDLGIQRLFLVVSFCVLDKCYLICWNTLSDKLLLHIIVDRKFPVLVWHATIAENHLR